VTSGRVIGVRIDPRLCSWIVEHNDCRHRRLSASPRASMLKHRRPGAQASGRGAAGDGRRSGLTGIVVFDEAARTVGSGTSSTRGSRLEEGWRDRGRQRHDQDPRLRPTKPERSGSIFEETEATGSSGTNDAELLGAAPPRPSVIAAEAGGSSSSEAPLDHVLRQGFGRAGGSWKPASPAKVGGEGDSRIERSKGYSSCRSVADAGKDASSPAGRSRPQGRERRRRVSSTRRLHVDDGGAARSGRKGAG
jgi:hypothetical protein